MDISVHACMSLFGLLPWLVMSHVSYVTIFRYLFAQLWRTILLWHMHRRLIFFLNFVASMTSILLTTLVVAAIVFLRLLVEKQSTNQICPHYFVSRFWFKKIIYVVILPRLGRDILRMSDSGQTCWFFVCVCVTHTRVHLALRACTALFGCLEEKLPRACLVPWIWKFGLL